MLVAPDVLANRIGHLIEGFSQLTNLITAGDRDFGFIIARPDPQRCLS